jgi:N-acetylmuramoyl-L-alanine amidase
MMESIKQYHIETNHWDDIGYHYVIEYDNGFPTIKIGRDEGTPGAHALGFNHKSLGICIVGNFDKGPLPWDKAEVLVHLIQRLMKKYNIPKENVLGHRETYILRNKPMEKSCPGRQISMMFLRKEL